MTLGVGALSRPGLQHSASCSVVAVASCGAPSGFSEVPGGQLCNTVRLCAVLQYVVCSLACCSARAGQVDKTEDKATVKARFQIKFEAYLALYRMLTGSSKSRSPGAGVCLPRHRLRQKTKASAAHLQHYSIEQCCTEPGGHVIIKPRTFLPL